MDGNDTLSVQGAQHHVATGLVGQHAHAALAGDEEWIAHANAVVEFDHARAQHIGAANRTTQQPGFVQFAYIAIAGGQRIAKSSSNGLRRPHRGPLVEKVEDGEHAGKAGHAGVASAMPCGNMFASGATSCAFFAVPKT